MAFDERFLDELKSRVNVAEVVGRKVKLVRKGREYSGLCPFHSEKTPSVTVNDQKGFYHCFGCGAHGDAIKFVCESEGLSFREAVERLAGEAGLEPPQETPFQREREEKRRTLYDVTAMAQAFFRERLAGPGGAAARAYLAKRALEPAIAERFGLGFAPEGRNVLIQHLTQKGVDLAEIVEAGLATTPEGRAEPIDFFRNRLTIPINDARGRTIAFGARTLLPDGKPKYINTGETPLFHKGRTLFNLDRARKPGFDAQSILVAEGYLDVIALTKGGFPHAVAPLGTALTEDQMGLLWRVAPEPVLCFDGDAAGKRAAYRALDRALPLLKPGQSLRFAFLPEGADPDDLIRRDGAGAMKAVADAALPLIEVLWAREREAGDTTTPERRAALQRRVEELAGSIQDGSVREHYQRELKDRLWAMFRPAAGGGRAGGAFAQGRPGFTPQPARPSLRNPPAPRGRFSGPPRPVYGNPASLKRSVAASGGRRDAAALTEWLMADLLVAYPGVILQDYETVEMVEFRSAALDAIRREALHFAVENEVLDETLLKDHLRGRGLADALAALEKRSAFAVDRAGSAGLSPHDVVMKWREALASYRCARSLKTAARQARGEWAREQTEGAKRALDEAEAAYLSGLRTISGDEVDF